MEATGEPENVLIESPDNAEVVVEESDSKNGELIKTTEQLFENVAEYIKGELLVTSGDYKVLEEMNNVAKDKYNNMTEKTHKLILKMENLQDKYSEFQPYLEKIDQIDQSVTELEETVQILDAYTKRLETKFAGLAIW